ncbi:MAG: elongation factor P [Patescibacteria group bacterium]
MLSYYDLRKGVQFLLEGQPYEVLEFQQMRKAQDVTVAQTKLRNLLSGKVMERNFHLNDTFEEAELPKFPAKFLYNHRGKFVFCFEDNPGKRFEFSQETLENTANFLRPNLPVTAIMFKDQIVNIGLPIKIYLKVKEAPPGVKGDRSQGGTKAVTLETGAVVQVPLFVETGDTIEVNTETGEYTRRIEKSA